MVVLAEEADFASDPGEFREFEADVVVLVDIPVSILGVGEVTSGEGLEVESGARDASAEEAEFCAVFDVPRFDGV